MDEFDYKQAWADFRESIKKSADILGSLDHVRASIEANVYREVLTRMDEFESN